MIGTYRFFEDGKQIAQQNNLITTAGKPEILRFMAGMNSNVVKSLSVGLSAVAATIADTALGFEVSRAGVTVTTPDLTANTLTVKATLDDSFAATIYEVGAWNYYDLYSQTTDVLLGFTQATDAWTNATWVTTVRRWGVDALRLTAPTSGTITSTLSGLTFDMSKYTDSQVFQFAISNNNAFTSSIAIRFMTDATNYYTVTFTGMPVSYTVLNFTKANAVATGNPSWSSITRIDLDVSSNASGGGPVMFDALRTDIRDNASGDNILISRAVLGTPVVKPIGIPLDIEYTIGMTVT